MNRMMILLAMCILVSGCATPGDTWKQVVGVSTKGIEETRPNALAKVFEYDYNTCYEKAEALLRKMPNTSIYAKSKSMIAVYVINPNTTSAGLFFTEIDAGHTKVEISSESTPTKEWVARNIFSEKVQLQEKPGISAY